MHLLFHLLLVLAGGILTALPTEAQSLRGSRGAVDRTYRQARGHALEFHKNAASVRAAAREGSLVKLSGNADYTLHQVSYPYVLPTTRTFIQRLARQYRGHCGEKLVVTSAVRPQTFRLANSVEKSVHPSGMAVDIRRPKRTRCASWLRSTLLHLEAAGALDATEERYPPHFHVAVFPSPYQRYLGGTPTRSASTGKAGSGGRSGSKSASSASARYRVKRGDTLWTIARRHGVSVERLKSANDLRASKIVVGQVLRIPSGP